MEEEMRKIEEEFAFQEKWIKIFQRGKFFFQNIPEHLILKIITKRKRSEVIKKERNQNIQQLRKIIQSKYHFFLRNYTWYGNLMEDLYLKEAYHFRRECWNIGFLRINKFPINISIINHLQPIIFQISMKQSGPLSENFNIPARTKSFSVKYASISDSDFYKEIERFGSLPLKVTFKREGHLELDELFSTLKGITQERHLHHPLQFLTYRRESRTNYGIFNSWPMDSFFPSSESKLFYFIIVAKSDVGVSVIYLDRFAWRGIEQLYTLRIKGVKSFDEWKKFTKRKIVDGGFNLEAGQTREKSDKQLARVLKVFSTQVASKFFERGKLVYPPLAPPEPAPEFVEFLKKFEDFDIQPEKMEPHKPKWKKTEKLPDLPRKLPEIHSNNWLIEAKEIIKLRKFWMDFLQKGKFILELMPLKNVLDIAKRIEATQFASLFTSCKWIHDLIQESHFRIHGGSWNITRQMLVLDPALESLRRKLDQIEYFYLRQISFKSFHKDMVFLKKIVTTIGEKKIFVKKIKLCFSPLIQEMISILKPIKVHFSGDFRLILADGLQFPPRLKHISVRNIQGSKMRETMASLTGLPIQVKWKVDDFSICEAVLAYLQQLKVKKSLNSNISIVIRSQLNYYEKQCGEILSTDQNASETVYVFSSMIKDQWMYYFRLEKCGEYGGAVGVAFYKDYQPFADQKATIKCEYFPKMEDFLSYFEREIGSKRNARQCGKKSKKEGSAKKATNNLISNAQKEEEKHFEEVRRRFFD